VLNVGYAGPDRLHAVRHDMDLGDGGSEASSCGSAFLMASTVAMSSAPTGAGLL
jgi:hypothetical protein